MTFIRIKQNASWVQDIFIADSANFQVNYAANTDKFTFRNLIHNYSYKALPLLDWGMDLLLERDAIE